jgi:hypothetical protein
MEMKLNRDAGFDWVFGSVVIDSGKDVERSHGQDGMDGVRLGRRDDPSIGRAGQASVREREDRSGVAPGHTVPAVALSLGGATGHLTLLFIDAAPTLGNARAWQIL